MSKAAHYLKPAWVRRQIELAFPLLPPGACLALRAGGKRLGAVGEDGEGLRDDTPGVRPFPLLQRAVTGEYTSRFDKFTD